MYNNVNVNGKGLQIWVNFKMICDSELEHEFLRHSIVQH